MIKKIYGLTDRGEQVELEFKNFLMITDNDSRLTLNIADLKHPENADLLLHIDTGPVVNDTSSQNHCLIPIEGHRYFNVLPGASNMVFIKVTKKTIT